MNFERFKAGFEELVNAYLSDHNIETDKPIYIYECNIDSFGDGKLDASLTTSDLYFVYTVSMRGRHENLQVFRGLGGLSRDSIAMYSDNIKYLKDSRISKNYLDGRLSGVPWAKDFPCNKEEE